MLDSHFGQSFLPKQFSILSLPKNAIFRLESFPGNSSKAAFIDLQTNTFTSNHIIAGNSTLLEEYFCFLLQSIFEQKI
jgi:hypothetical protein